MASIGSSFNTGMDDTSQATLVAGLLSYQDAETIGQVSAAVRDAFAHHFEGLPSKVLLADCGSTDGTVARVHDTLGDGNFLALPQARPRADVMQVPYHGIPGKARALYATLTKARELGATACIILDGSVSTVTPQWIDWLTRPVVEHAFDFVCPYYRRHRVEGALTKGIVYPLVRALYGVRLRQPVTAEFACSRRLIDRLLGDDLWAREGAQVAIDLWVTSAAASGDFRLGEAELGIRTHHSRGAETLDLGTTIVQVVGSLFADLEGRAERWQRVRGSVAVQRFGSVTDRESPHAPAVDVERLIEAFRLGYRELRDIWTWVLPPRTIVDLRKLVDGDPAGFRLNDDLWARIVYDFALGYRLRVLPRHHLLRSLVPLYSGWLASFVPQVRELSLEAVDQRVDDLALAFEAQKPYLISRWRWPERLRTG